MQVAATISTDGVQICCNQRNFLVSKNIIFHHLLHGGSSGIILCNNNPTGNHTKSACVLSKHFYGPSPVFQYFVESTDRWGGPLEAGQPVECKELDGVLPLRDHQQGYGGLQAVYLVNNTQDKQVYFQHEVIARGTVIMTAEGETEKFMNRYSPHPNRSME